jgi:hypothetical protein
MLSLALPLRCLPDVPQVPVVDDFSQDTQLNAQFIQRLQKKHVCHNHRNESGGPGCCYVHPETGAHLALNMWRLKHWAAWIVSADHAAV